MEQVTDTHTGRAIPVMEKTHHCKSDSPILSSQNIMNSQLHFKKFFKNKIKNINILAFDSPCCPDSLLCIVNLRIILIFYL
jgi:hypothetical protein